jgi:hypothetical protein
MLIQHHVRGLGFDSMPGFLQATDAAAPPVKMCARRSLCFDAEQ